MKLPPKVPEKKRSPRRGSALIAILWVVGILSIAVFSATHFLFLELESESNASSIFQAEQMADRGIALAGHPGIKRGDPLLNQTFERGEGFLARVSTEGERLNLNSLLENPEDDRMVLEELFTEWGLRHDEATDVVDNLIDWVDDDDEPTNLGAERQFYLNLDRPRHPFNRPFDALSEVELVNEFQLVMSVKPDWKDSFTLLSGGKLDLNEAPADLIRIVCEVGMREAEIFVDTRNGIDQVRGTEDDYPFESVEDALAILSIPPGFAERIEARVTVDDDVKRIVSLGRSGDVTVERVATIQYTGESGEILQWSTRRVE